MQVAHIPEEEATEKAEFLGIKPRFETHTIPSWQDQYIPYETISNKVVQEYLNFTSQLEKTQSSSMASEHKLADEVKNLLSDIDGEIIEGVDICVAFCQIQESKCINLLHQIFETYWKSEKATEMEMNEVCILIRSLSLKLTKVFAFIFSNIDVFHELLELVKRLTQAFTQFKALEYFERYLQKQEASIRYLIEHKAFVILHHALLAICGHFKFKLNKPGQKNHHQELTFNLLADHKKAGLESFYYLYTQAKEMFAVSENQENWAKNPVANLNFAEEILNKQKTFLEDQFMYHFSKFGFRFDLYYSSKETTKRVDLLMRPEKMVIDQFTKVFTGDRSTVFKESAVKMCYSMTDLTMVIIHGGLVLVNIGANNFNLGEYQAALNYTTALSVGIQVAVQVSTFLSYLCWNMYSNTQFKYPYLLSIVFMMVGNLLYYLGPTFLDNRTTVLGLMITGRILIGFGSVKVLSLKFITLCVEVRFYTLMVTFYILDISIGLCLGPGLVAFWEYMPGTRSLGPTLITRYTGMSFIFMFIWVITFFWFLFYFDGLNTRIKQYYVRMIRSETLSKRKGSMLARQPTAELDTFALRGQKIIEEAPQDYELLASDPKTKQIYRELASIAHRLEPSRKKNFPFVVAFFPNSMALLMVMIFFMMKAFVQTACVSEAAPLSLLHFGHNTQWVGYFFLFSLLYAPVAMVGAIVFIQRGWEDKSVLILALVISLVGCLLKINYHYDQPMGDVQFYYGTAVVIIGTLMLEVGTVATLGLVISPNFKMGYVNAGLIFTCVGVLADLLGSLLPLIYTQIDGQAAVPFYMYIVGAVILSVSMVLVLYNYHKIQKYKTIKVINESVRDFEKEGVE